MQQLTFFLLAVVFGLGLGNALLIFLKSRQRQGHRGLKALAEQVSGKGISTASSVHAANPFAIAETQFSGRPVLAVTPADKKIELAHWRLQALESRVKSMQGIYEDSMRAKIDKLEGFKATATAEIIALKEIVAEMQKRQAPGNGSGSKQAGEAQDISTDELRKIIYRSQN